jgi:hypothetical protein
VALDFSQLAMFEVTDETVGTTDLEDSDGTEVTS